MLRVTVRDERDGALLRRRAVPLVGGEQVHGMPVAHHAFGFGEDERAIERNVGQRRRLCGNGGGADLELDELVRRELCGVDGELRAGLPARKNPREELRRHVAEVVRARGLLLEEGVEGRVEGAPSVVHACPCARHHALGDPGQVVPDEAPVEREARRRSADLVHVLGGHAARFQVPAEVPREVLFGARGEAGVGDHLLDRHLKVTAPALAAHGRPVTRWRGT